MLSLNRGLVRSRNIISVLPAGLREVIFLINSLSDMHHEFINWLLVLKFEHWAVFHQTIGEVVLCLDLLEVVYVIYSTLEV
jgi:hypothetical protein